MSGRKMIKVPVLLEIREIRSPEDQEKPSNSICRKYSNLKHKRKGDSLSLGIKTKTTKSKTTIIFVEYIKVKLNTLLI